MKSGIFARDFFFLGEGIIIMLMIMDGVVKTIKNDA